MMSIVFAALGAAALLELGSPWGAWLCAIAIVLRLLCNLFDGLVAVAHARKTPTGVLYNEVPDRVADSLFLVALGYAAGMPWCGWLAALLAALTRSDEHTSELQSLMRISYAVFCLKK